MRAGQVAVVNEMRTLMRQGPPSLRNIQDDTVQVIDVLGATIPVPIFFCATWEVRFLLHELYIVQSHILVSQGFDHIIKGYFKNRAGSDYVERGDYHILRAEDNQTIASSELGRTVKAGMLLEMSIIMRQTTPLKAHETKCPRCHHTNSDAMLINGWVEWKVSQPYL